MDREKAVRRFADNLDRMTRLPLATDEDMLTLYGEEVVRAVAELDRMSRETRLCEQCAGQCCLAVRCELYLPHFGKCPIHSLRPPICRLHYCHKFFPDDDTYLKELSDVFFDGLLTAQAEGNKRVWLFDSPPMVRCALGLVDAAAPIVEAVREGKLGTAEALEMIGKEADKFRAPPP